MAVERIDYYSEEEYLAALQFEAAQEAQAKADYEYQQKQDEEVFWQTHDICPICNDVKEKIDLHRNCGK